MYVCVHVYVCMCMYNVGACVCTCMHLCVHVYVGACVCTCMYVCVHLHVGGGGAAVLGCSESAASRVRLARFGGKPLQCCQLCSVPTARLASTATPSPLPGHGHTGPGQCARGVAAPTCLQQDDGCCTKVLMHVLYTTLHGCCSRMSPAESLRISFRPEGGR